MFHITYFNLLHALCFSACLAHSFEYYVSTIGSDGNTGTAAAPFRTLSRAQNEVRGKLPSQTSNIYVYVEDGVYELDSPLNLTARDSGQNGFKVIWQAKGTLVNVSGGNQITNWTMYNKTAGIYQATVPKNSISRHLYANQVHAQRARATLTRSWLSATTSGYLVVNSAANYLLSLPGIEHGEIRGINSFTDRYIPVDSVSDGVILMKQPAYQNNIIGYDTITVPAADEGFYIENVLALLDEPNEFYLNSSTNTVYYIPPVGLDPNDMYIVLPKNEQVLVFSGTLDEPVHDIMFVGFNFMHTTWNYPSGDVGYADQQTGAFIGLNESYTIFESSRPFWWQVPGSIQMSAAHDIVIQNGSMVAIMGGFGIGNDPNAHTSGVGLGANNITISGIYFTQTGHNCITVGGVQADAHHPSDSRMLNSNIMISENIFSNTQITYTSGVPIFVSYATNAQIIHNDISVVPYSGICYGFGWGSNDAGGSEEYLLRGLYNYQPIYTTPTTLTDGLISNNLIHDYGLRHTDLGGIYTLSKSPNTFITENYAYSDNGYGLYNDEGSRNYVHTNSVFNVTDAWLNRNERTNYTTGNLTYASINTNQASIVSQTNSWGDTINNAIYSLYMWLPLSQKRVVYMAGISPSRRANADISISPNAAFLYITQSGYNSTVDVQNLGTEQLTEVVFNYQISSGWSVSAENVPPTSVQGNSEGFLYLTASKIASTATATATVSIAVTYNSVVRAESLSGLYLVS